MQVQMYLPLGPLTGAEYNPEAYQSNLDRPLDRRRRLLELHSSTPLARPGFDSRPHGKGATLDGSTQ